jgi:hypothetical protein
VAPALQIPAHIGDRRPTSRVHNMRG